jgi:hypothetical protein
MTFGFALAFIFASGPAQTLPGTPAVLRPDTVATIGNVTVTRWHSPRMTVVEVPDTLVFWYRPHNDAPLDSVARREDFRCLINGSFFDGARGDAGHAGWLSQYGLRISPLRDDRQLTHIVRCNGTTRIVEFLSARSFETSGDHALLEFQTGPLIIDGGDIRADLIQSSINGPTRHTRSLLATLDRHRCFLITVTEQVRLFDLAATVQRLSIFQNGRLDVINLDGGSSVALFLRDVHDANYNVDDRLPILIGFH